MPRRLLLLGLTISCLTIQAGLARAQEQENKLVDRLLRPDMSLSNSAQNKKFVAAEGTSVDRTFEAKSFYSGKEHAARPFAGMRDFFARTFGTKRFSRDRAATVANSESAYANMQARTNESSLMQTAPEQNKTANTRDYADNRPFLGQGTRQKILSQQDRPLSIDEVRELLNKNR